LKDLVGTKSTTTMLNLTSLVKAKDALSSLVLPVPILTNSAVEVAEDALLLEEEVVHAVATLSPMDANITILMRIMTVTTMMDKITLDFLISKSMEEVLAANALLAL